MEFSKPKHLQATLTYKKKVSSKVYEAKIRLITPQAMTFIAGQTVMLKVGAGINRAMTIASPPEESEELTIFQDVSPMGPGSIWMINLKVGDPVSLVGPLGRFVLDPESPRPRVCIATGTGIAPFRAMFLDADSQWSRRGSVSFYWGLRRQEDMFLTKELETFCRDHPLLQFYFTLSQPSETWTGLRGHVTEHVFQNERDLPTKDFYLCGSKAMIKEMQERLKDAGVPLSHMKFDPFF